MNEEISNDYLAGFADGEGCFYVGIVPARTARFGWQIITEFRVSQNPRGRIILETFRERLGCGTIKPNHRFSLTDKTFVFVVRDQTDLSAKVIPFFERYPIQFGKVRGVRKIQNSVVADSRRNAFHTRRIRENRRYSE